jgi:capsular exopolysaccharide synthesis family protein
MSRIEDALARAKNLDASKLTVPSRRAEVTDALAGPAFATEEDERTATEANESFPPPSPISLASESSFAESPAKQDSADGPVVEIDGDLSRLPGVEKLTLGAQDSSSIEQYRRLAARLLLAQVEKGTRLVMVTSAMPGEGKTLTSANLALTLSESYKRPVLLIDGDFRRPSIHEVFNLPNVSGLNDGLRVDSERKIPLLSYTEHLTILTAGRPDADPMGVLSGEQMRRVLTEAARQFEFVIIDTPPVALLPDAHVLANLVDGVLLVIESGRSPLPALKKAVEAVGRDRVLGVVLNRARSGVHGGSYDYYGDYRRYTSDQVVATR